MQEATYQYKKGGGFVTVRLTEDCLSYSYKSRQVEVSFSEIKHVNLITMSAPYYVNCRVRTTKGAFDIINRTHGDEKYSQFIESLHGCLQSLPGIKFTLGSSFMFYLLLLFAILLGCSLVAIGVALAITRRFELDNLIFPFFLLVAFVMAVMRARSARPEVYSPGRLTLIWSRIRKVSQVHGKTGDQLERRHTE